MKKLLYISGIISLMLIYLGGVFKIYNLPFASILLILGLGILMVAFIPSALINNYKNNGKEFLLLYIMGFLTVLFVFTGVLFNIMHWPGAHFLLPFSMFAPFVLFLPAFYNYFKTGNNISFNDFILVLFIISYFGMQDAVLAINPSKKLITTGIQQAKFYNNSRVQQESANAFILITLDNTDACKIHSETESIVRKIDSLKLSLLNKHPNKVDISIVQMKDFNFDIPLNWSNRRASYRTFFREGGVLALKENVADYLQNIDDENELTLKSILQLEKSLEQWDYRIGMAEVVLVFRSLSELQYEILLLENQVFQQYLLESKPSA